MKTLSLLVLVLSFDVLAYSKISAKKWQPLSAKQKYTMLGKYIRTKPYFDNQLPTNFPLFGALQIFDVNHIIKVFTIPHDIYPKSRRKLIHTYGSAAQVSLRINDRSKYTGLLAPGTKAYGIARLSLAKEPPSYTPGMALKLLVDGRPSENILVMNSLDGQGENYNFFAKNFSNIIPGPSNPLLSALAFSFKMAIQKLNPRAVPTNLPTANLSKVKVNGQRVRKYNSPAQLIFRPLVTKFDKNDRTDLRIQLKALKPGTTLYKVYARKSKNSGVILIGELVLESKFVASKFSDRWLLFQHNAFF